MAYSDFTKYYDEKQRKSNTSRKSTQQYKKRSANSSQNGKVKNTAVISQVYKTKTRTIGKNTGLTKAKLKKKKLFKKKLQKALIFSFLTLYAMGVAYNYADAKMQNSNNISNTQVESGDVEYSNNQSNTVSGVDLVIQNLSSNVSTTNTPQESSQYGAIDKSLEKQLKNYKDYCYYGYYGDEEYLYCPEEYVLKLAEYAINKLNYQYQQSGKMNSLSNGKYIPDIISPKLLTAIAMTESSYRVETKSGKPLGYDRQGSRANNAEGILQQKPAFVEDASNFSLTLGGEEYTKEDRYNPLTAMEICVTNLNRIYRAYLQNGKSTYKALATNGTSEDELLGALIIAYNQGEGAMSKWAKSGKLDGVIANPKSTSSYGADYLRSVTKYMNEIEDRINDSRELND